MCGFFFVISIFFQISWATPQTFHIPTVNCRNNPGVHECLVGHDLYISLEHVTGNTARQCLFLEYVGDLTCSPLVMESQQPAITHTALTCWGCLVEAGQGQKTLPVTCCVNVHLFACASVHMRVNVCAFLFVLGREWLILKCRILTECSAIPGGTRPQGRNRRAAFTFFISLSLPPLPSLIPHIHPPFQSNPLLFLPTSLMGLLICNIDIYCWLKWAAALRVVGGDSWCGSIRDRHAWWFALREFTAAVDLVCVKLLSIGRKINGKVWGNIADFQYCLNRRAYWHSLQSIHSPITYCLQLYVFTVYSYCTLEGVRK